jgi:ferrous iron transport protein A
LKVVFTVTMATLPFFSFDLMRQARTRHARPAGMSRVLGAVPCGVRVRIVRLAQDDAHAAWLRAVGMHEGAEVTVLRRAPFGGPIHLRSADGGEFAIHRDLASCIEVEPAGPSQPGSMV